MWNTIYNFTDCQKQDEEIDSEIDSNTSEKDEKKSVTKADINGYLDTASYVHTTLNNTFIPKQSTSCYENFDSLINTNGDESDSKSTTTNSINNSRSESPNFTSFMKKSTSVNSALSKHLDRTRRFSNRLSSFGSNISLSYFTSTLTLFTSDK